MGNVFGSPCSDTRSMDRFFWCYISRYLAYCVLIGWTHSYRSVSRNSRIRKSLTTSKERRQRLRKKQLRQIRWKWSPDGKVSKAGLILWVSYFISKLIDPSMRAVKVKTYNRMGDGGEDLPKVPPTPSKRTKETWNPKQTKNGIPNLHCKPIVAK